MTLIAIDPGHGNNTYPPDKGVPGLPEHTFNAEVALKLDKRLRDCGFETFFVQEPHAADRDLTARTDEANQRRADLYVSIHANAGAGEGACVFYWHSSSASRKMAKLVRDELKRFRSLHGNGLHRCKRGSWTNLHVCRETAMPAILIEHGFMTNSKDKDLLLKDNYRERCAEANAKAICQYFGVPYKAIKSEKEDDEMNKVIDGNTKAAWLPTIRRWADPDEQRNPIGQSWVEKIENDEMTYADLMRLMGEERKRGLA